MTIKRILIIILFMIISGALQHVTHELLHLIIGKLNGLKFLKIQWLTYHGGTKVFFENEPDFGKSEEFSKSWVYMSSAGIIGTTVLAYFFVVIYCFIPLGYFKLFMWVLSIFFLVTDSGYALLGSIGNFGDTYLIKKYYKLGRTQMTLLSLPLFILNICILYFVIL
mgnify:CR=1 FL=1